MMFNATPQDMRQMFFQTREKMLNQVALTPLEQQIANVIQQHPEYHTILDQPLAHLNKQFSTDNNPFLHMALHLGLYEQLSTDRPAGIRHIYQTLRQKFQDPHTAEHHMMQVLAETIASCQQTGKAPVDATYLKQLKQLT